LVTTFTIYLRLDIRREGNGDGDVRKKLILSVITFVLFMATMQTPLNAAANRTVSVKLPSFQVTVDGQNIDSTKLKYPLLVYKDITYFPLTWHVGKGMGLKTHWSQESGLSIIAFSNNKTLLTMEAGNQFVKGKPYKAQIVDSPVTVEGVKIDHSKETYPLLLFQEVTYFPMTWRYAHDSFNWNTSWDRQTGLAIQTMQQVYFDQIIYDDERYLYAPNYYNGGLWRISKDLEDVPDYMNNKQSEMIWKAVEERWSLMHPTLDNKLELVQSNDRVYYEGIELYRLERYKGMIDDYYEKYPYLPVNTDISVDAIILELDEQTKLLNATTYYVLDIPGPHTPNDTQTFIVKNGEVTSLKAFTQMIDGMMRREDGLWIWSQSPEVISGDTALLRGQLIWVGFDGKVLSFNELLNAQNVQYLGMDEADVIVKAFTLTMDTHYNEGFYRVRSDGEYELIAEFLDEISEDGARLYGAPKAYVDQQGILYALTPDAEHKQNGVKNVVTGDYIGWWDYTLWEAFGKPAW
jgi:hypothetical protein